MYNYTFDLVSWSTTWSLFINFAGVKLFKLKIQLSLYKDRRINIDHFLCELVPGQKLKCLLTLSLPDSVMETFEVILTFESVDDFLWCDYSNETSSVVLLRGTIYI